jgi:hypothetical protein
MDEQSLRELCNLQGAQAPASPLAVESHSKMAGHNIVTILENILFTVFWCSIAIFVIWLCSCS